jgi:hypothetical protein
VLISEAQAEVRAAYLGGFVGQLVSSLIWFASAAVATFVDPKTGFWTLAIGGVAIFPLTKALLHIAGRSVVPNPKNSLNQLGMQVAFTVPIVLPLAGIAALHNLGWFYPACMIIVGAHYLPFIFLYGMKTFAALAATLVCAGFAIGMMAPNQLVMGGWVGSVVLFAFAFGLLVAYKRSLAETGHEPKRMSQGVW